MTELHRLVDDLSKSFNESRDAELRRQYLNLCKIHPAPISRKDLWVCETEEKMSFNDGKVSLCQMVELKHVDDERMP